MLPSLSMNSMANMPDMLPRNPSQAFGLAEYAVFKGEVDVAKCHIEQVCNVLTGEVMYCVLDSADSVVEGYLDRYECVQGYDVQTARVWQRHFIEVFVLYWGSCIHLMSSKLFLGELWCFEQGLEGSGKHPRDAL